MPHILCGQTYIHIYLHSLGISISIVFASVGLALLTKISIAHLANAPDFSRTGNIQL